jgi:predicted lipid-binding transport protein (Tim44 family)
MGGGGFPIDLLLFGMIAAFLVLRLRGILGRRTGFERPPQTERPGGPVAVPGIARAPQAVDAKIEHASAGRPLPDPASPVGITLQRMRSVDRNFDPAHFLMGAEAAFRMIIAAFAVGDRIALRPLLADQTYASFEQAIAAREAANETQRSEVRSIERASIEQALLDGTTAHITVQFVSDQIAETLGADGRPVAGADAVTEITDIWTFQRDLSQPDPAWRLSAARSG